MSDWLQARRLQASVIFSPKSDKIFWLFGKIDALRFFFTLLDTIVTKYLIYGNYRAQLLKSKASKVNLEVSNILHAFKIIGFERKKTENDFDHTAINLNPSLFCTTLSRI